MSDTGEIQLFLKNRDKLSCNFCTRREPALFTIASSSPAHNLELRLCKFCAEKLSLCFNSINWEAQSG